MTHIRKATLVCDKCGYSVPVDPSVENLFPSSVHRDVILSDWPVFDIDKILETVGFVFCEKTLRRWIEVEGHHLCPYCSKTYVKTEQKCKQMLKEAAGIKSI